MEINIFDVLTICSNFLIDPENKENDFIKLKEQIEIKPFLYLYQKEAIIEKVLKDIKARSKVDEFTSNVELCLTFDALLAYTNIECDIVENAKDANFYDLIWGSGLGDYILQYCEKDYLRLEKMVYHMLSYENLFTLIEQLDHIDSKSIEDLTNEFKLFRVETRPESLKVLGDIAAKDDPFLYNIKETIEKSAIDSLKEIEKNGSGENL